MQNLFLRERLARDSGVGKLIRRHHAGVPQFLQVEGKRRPGHIQRHAASN